MNNALHVTGRWLFACLLASLCAFFLGLSQDRNASLPDASSSRVPWRASSAWAYR